MNEELSLSPSEKRALAARGFSDPVWFCRYFLPEWFPSEIPWVHRGILSIVLRKTEFLKTYGELEEIFSNFFFLEDPSDEKSPRHPIFILEEGQIKIRAKNFVEIMMPRGFSKTTLLNACVLMMILYHEREFPVYLSESGPHAEAQLGNVKRQLAENPKIQMVFGDLRPGRQDSAKWREDEIETTSGVFALARGRGGQVRGTNRDARRPDQIIIDDVEDEESVNTEEQRKKTRKWFYEAVRPALAKMNPSAGIVVLGTLLHKEALLQILSLDPAFTVIRFGAVAQSGSALWPEMMSLSDLETTKLSFAAAGNLAGFYREYHNVLRDDESAPFKERFLRWGRPSEEIVIKALACDPAISEHKKSDYFALGCAGMTEKGSIVVLGCEGWRGLSPREQVNKYFEWHTRFNLIPSDHHGVESNAYQKALIHLIREEMFRRHTYFEVEEIRHGRQDGDKITRIKGVLQPRYAAGYIWHATKFPLLEQLLLDFPNDKLDLPDVIAMAITMLDPQAALAAGPEVDLAADEYEPIRMNWRTAP